MFHTKYMSVLMQVFIFTCPFCVHLDANHSQVGCTNAHAGAFLVASGLHCSHPLDGVDTHDGHSVAWDHAVTQIPGRGEGNGLNNPSCFFRFHTLALECALYRSQ